MTTTLSPTTVSVTNSNHQSSVTHSSYRARSTNPVTVIVFKCEHWTQLLPPTLTLYIAVIHSTSHIVHTSSLPLLPHSYPFATLPPLHPISNALFHPFSYSLHIAFQPLLAPPPQSHSILTLFPPLSHPISNHLPLSPYPFTAALSHPQPHYTWHISKSTKQSYYS